VTSPLKIDDKTDRLATEGAHFLGQTKKQYVADAEAYYTDLRRGEIEKGMRASLATLDGGRNSAVRLLTVMSEEQIEELGGLS
jgi:hypothetical protein